MRLPWPRRWRRRPTVAVVEQPVYRPGSWAKVPLPPAVAGEPPAVAGGPPAAPPVPAVPPPSVPADAAPSGPAVRLGFSDGSSVVLDESSDQAEALRTIATSLAFKDEPAGHH